jgi:hypothetical protein
MLFGVGSILRFPSGISLDVRRHEEFRYGRRTRACWNSPVRSMMGSRWARSRDAGLPNPRGFTDCFAIGMMLSGGFFPPCIFRVIPHFAKGLKSSHLERGWP